MKWMPWLGLGLLMGCAALETSMDSTIEVSANERPAHHTDEGFQNPYPIDDIERGFFTYWRMRFFSGAFPDYAEVAHKVPRVSADADQLRQPPAKIRVTWIGHATFLIQYRGINILTDPHFSERASPLSFIGPKRLVPLPIELAQLPPIDLVPISHNHYDHLDKQTVIALGDGPRWVVPLRLKSTLMGWGIAAERVAEFDWWESGEVGPIWVRMTPTHHLSGRGLFDRNETLWGAWLFRVGGTTLWFGGDTAYNPIHFKQIGERVGPIDLALIPIGAYEPRWFMRAAHVTPEEAVKVHREIGSRQSIGMHWGVFQLTSEPMLEPPQRLRQALQEANVSAAEFITLKIGESWTLESHNAEIGAARYTRAGGTG